MPELTIGIYSRERFSLLDKCIEALVRNTHVAFNLVIVDCNMPERYRRRLARAIAGIGNAKVLKFDEYLLPNQSRNLIMESSSTDYVCFLESDVYVGPDAIERLLETAKATHAAVVRPAIYQRRGVVHFDRWLGPVTDSAESADGKMHIGSSTAPSEYVLGQEPRRVEWTELHCLLLHKPSMRQVFPLDGELTEPEHVDLGLRLRAAGAPIFYEPRAVVRLNPPPTVQRDEREFFGFRWSPERARQSHQRFRQRWNVEYTGLEAWIATVPSRQTWWSYSKAQWRSWLRELMHGGRPTVN